MVLWVLRRIPADAVRTAGTPGTPGVPGDSGAPWWAPLRLTLGHSGP